MTVLVEIRRGRYNGDGSFNHSSHPNGGQFMKSGVGKIVRGLTLVLLVLLVLSACSKTDPNATAITVYKPPT
jgi:hypothetical protein